jgi:1,2-diacylglycerol 3-alpha-glucosyltransferase
MRRVAFFTDSWLPNVDGVVTSLLNYRHELERRGDRVWVFTTGSRDTLRRRDDRVYRYRALPFPPYPQYRLALYPFRATKHAREAGIDLVHCHAIASMGLAARVTARVLRLPLVGTFHTMVPQGVQLLTSQPVIQRLGERLAWRAVRAFYRPFDLVTAPSEAARRSLEEHGVAAPTVVVPNGIDTERFHPRVSGERVRRELGLEPREKLVLTAGRLSHEKHVEVLLQAFRLVRSAAEARLVITGRGPAERSLHALSRELGLQNYVTFTGFVPSVRLPEYYAAADVMATASTFETQGLSVLEAMAAGTPVVGARALAIPESVREGRNGRLFEPFDVEDCAEKLVSVLAAPRARYERLAKNARATAERYSIPRATDALVRAYGRVL